MISNDNRERFQQIGRDRLEFALATGTLQSLGVTENIKAEAKEWLKEQDAKRKKEEMLLRVAAIASVIAAIAAIIALFR
jgi:hypothetical protein